MIDPVDFFDLVSDKANRDSTVRRNFLAHIDENYDPSRYPQELPRVMSPGQPLSHKGYTCLDSYRPMPSDRVMLVPVGVSDYVIVGVIEPSYEDQEGLGSGRGLVYPGQLIFSANNQGVGQDATSSLQYVSWGDSLMYDPFGMWQGPGSPHSIVSPVTDSLEISGRMVFPNGAVTRWEFFVLTNTGSGDIDTRGGWFRSENGSATVGVPFSMIGGYPLLRGEHVRLRAQASMSGVSFPYPDGVYASHINIYFQGETPVYINSL